MSTPFDTPLAGYRFVRSQYGDTLRDVALRELGDARYWSDLIAINNLLPPYLTDDPAERSDQVILNGTDYIVIPTAAASASQPNPDDAFGTDIALGKDGFPIITAGGDFATVSGLDNLRQAIVNALATDEGELMYHPAYGTLIRRIIGTVSGPTGTLLAASYAKATIEADQRIQQIDASVAVNVNDSISVTVVAETINGSTLPVTSNLS